MVGKEACMMVWFQDSGKNKYQPNIKLKFHLNKGKDSKLFMDFLLNKDLSKTIKFKYFTLLRLSVNI